MLERPTRRNKCRLLFPPEPPGLQKSTVPQRRGTSETGPMSTRRKQDKETRNVAPFVPTRFPRSLQLRRVIHGLPRALAGCTPRGGGHPVHGPLVFKDGLLIRSVRPLSSPSPRRRAAAAAAAPRLFRSRVPGGGDERRRSVTRFYAGDRTDRDTHLPTHLSDRARDRIDFAPIASVLFP